jgi:hypothetical protein
VAVLKASASSLFVTIAMIRFHPLSIYLNAGGLLTIAGQVKPILGPVAARDRSGPFPRPSNGVSCPINPKRLKKCWLFQRPELFLTCFKIFKNMLQFLI